MKNVEDLYPLSPMQQGLLFHSLLAPESGFYVTQLSCTVRAGLNTAAFEEAWQKVLVRHPILRTAFMWEGLDEPLQLVRQKVQLSIEQQDWRGDGENTQQERFEQLLEADRQRGFDLSIAPLMRLYLIRVEDEAYRFVWSSHHILLDGWSASLLLKEVFTLYEAFAAGKQIRLEEVPPYSNYIAWLQEQDKSQAEAFWRHTLAGFTVPTPFGIGRPVGSLSEQDDTYGEYKFSLSAELTSALQTLARQQRLTLNTLIQGAWALLLSRYSREKDVVFGMTVSGRPAALPAVEQMIGLFINTLPVRVLVPDDASLLSWLKQLQEQQQKQAQFDYTPLIDIQKWSDVERGQSLFESILGFENYPVDEALRNQPFGFEITDLRFTEKTNFPINLAVMPDKELVLDLMYSSRRFDEATMLRLCGHLETLLRSFVANPNQRLSALPIVTEAEQQQMFRDWNQTAALYPQEVCLHQLFEAQTARRPEDIALSFQGVQLSYRELNSRANRFAHYLRTLGVGPEVLVGLMVERSVEMVVALLGVLKAGGAYLPLDPSYPIERLSFMLDDAHAPVLVTRASVPGELVSERVKVVVLEKELKRIEQEPDENLTGIDVVPQNLAYVIYTSGSTGQPKGVLITHRAVINHNFGIAELYELQPHDRVLQFASLSFDVAVEEIFPTWLRGGCVVLRPEGVLSSHTDFFEFLKKERISVVNLTTPYWNELMAEAARTGVSVNGSLRLAAIGGEKGLPEGFDFARKQIGHGVRLMNVYGPTETTVTNTVYEVNGVAAHEEAVSVPIGRPIANTQLYILDDQQQPLPVGVGGELHIGTDSLARGYLNRPQQTAEKFIPNPFSDEPGARLYKTGDVARFLSDGNVEFLGRVDHQVKVRGFRIELGEIEAVLTTHDDVREVVVIAREDAPGDKRVVAYVVPERELKTSELRNFVLERLPEHMCPSAFVILEAFPLTSNGKVNRRALPAPDHAPNQQGENFVAPRTPVEDLLAGIWADVLSLRQVGIDDDFFELGGHSLLATQLMSRLREAFSIEIPLRQLFESPTIAELAQHIETARKTETQLQAPAIVPVSREGVLPLSFAQQRLWFMDQLEPGSNRFNISAAIRLSGQLNLEALERTLAEIIRRHESLRTSFVAVDGEPVHVISPAGEVSLSFTDLSTESSREARARELAATESQRPFDLSRGPLLRTQLLRLGESEHILLLTMHHIITDGWSTGVLVKEVVTLYSAYIQDLPSPLPELNIQYADFAHWQRNWLQGEVLNEQLAYWRERLAGAPALLELPTDRARPAVQSFHGAQHRFCVSAELTEQLQQLSRREGVTLFMTLLAAFQTLLWRYSGESDVVVGADVANRNRHETEALIGFFVNMLVLRTRVSGEASFAELLQQVREVCLGGYAHQDVPFEKLVEELQPERSLSHTPLFQVVFVLQNQPMGELTLPGLRLSEMEIKDEKAIFDLILDMVETPQGLEAFFSYNTDLFDAETIERMSQHLVVLLERVVAEPELALSRHNLLAAGERELLEQWNDTVRAYPEQSLAQLFEEQVENAPQQVATVYEGEELSYEELNRRANQLAHRLRSLGVGPEVLVGVLLERSVEMVVGLLGILKAGGGYLPLDRSYPLERLSYMLEDAQAPVLLTQEHLLDSVPAAYWGTVLTLDQEQESLASESEENPDSEWLGGEQLCYVAYTSGSTGQPKGVAVPQRAVVRLVKGSNYAEFSAADSMLQLAPLSFDAATLEVWGSLLNGGRLVVMKAGQPTLAELARVIEGQKVSMLWLTAGLFHQMVDEQLETLRGVRQVLAGGDVLSPGHVERLLEADEGERWVINGYGPTENTTFSSCYRMQAGTELSGRSVSIGMPITNTQVYVLDEEMALVPVGVAGELYVGGAGLARGYLQQAELTAERFVPHPHSTEPGARLYRTGDVVRYRRGGELEFVGRRDEQVKVRGFRIELGEVEAALVSHAAVKEAVVIARADERGEKRLVAYVVREPEALALPAAGEWRKYLSAKLPDHMMPSFYVELAELPLNANGKVERRQLPAPETVRTDKPSGVVLAQTQIEKLVAGMWEQVLGIEQAGMTEDFFELGGHSLLATQLMSRVRDTFGIEVPLRQLFEAPTIAELAQHIETVLKLDAQLQGPAVVPVSRENALPLSFAQQRLWFIDQLEPESALYNVPAVLSLKGVLDIDVLKRTLDEVVRRHESLRTTFNTVDGQPLQIISPVSPPYFSLYDISDLPEPERQSQFSNLIAAETQRPFNLGTGPVWRVTLLKLEELDYVLVVNLHHIVSDAWSLGVLVNEIAALYSAFLHAQPSPLPELIVQYADFAHWQRNWFQDDVLERQLSYWRAQLSGAPALLELPADRPRPAVQSFRGADHKFTLDVELIEKLQELSRREGVTLFMTLLAAFQTLLWRYSGEPDVVIGTPIAGRNRSETEQLIGFFVNTLVLRTRVEGKEDFTNLLKRVRETALGAFAHQDMPFEKLVEELEPERNLSHSPLFQVMFAMQNSPLGALELPGLQLSLVADEVVQSKFDLILGLDESPTGIQGEWIYNTDLFDASTIERMNGHFQTLLAGIVTNPQHALCDLPLLTNAERKLLLEDWNETPVADPQALCLHELFEAQAERTPEAVALVFGDERLNYRELNERANQVAHHLQVAGIGPESIVGLLLERSAELVVALLGVLKAGAAYLPLDLAYPEERQRYMMADAGMQLLLTQATVQEIFAQSPESAEVKSTVSWENLAYVIYTSGSTGQPKGVAITHESAAALVRWANDTFARADLAGVLFSTSICFDLSVFELFVPLSCGGAVILATNALELPKLPAASEVTLINTVPSALKELLRNGDLPPSVKIVNLAGEALSRQLVDDAYKQPQIKHVWNLYGPTEDTTYSTGAIIKRGEVVEPSIGPPIKGSHAYVLDRALQPVAVGVIGELYLGGVGVARGYLGRPELTAERFVPSLWSGESGERLYRTGDLVRWRNDGELEYLGRSDHQVKIRGFRIELGEVETELARHESVREAVVVARESADGSKLLVAYIISNGTKVSATTLRQHLLQRLPEWMAPNLFIELEKWPLTPNGKIDRKALPATEGMQPEMEQLYVAPRTAQEEILLGIWQQLLGVAQVSIHDNFFTLGGHSLLATQLMSRVREAFAVDIPLRQLFEGPTIAELAQHVEAARQTDSHLSAPPMLPVSRDQRLPLSFAQQRLWFVDQLNPGSTAYNVPLAVRFNGSLSPEILNRTFTEIVRRHEILRTRFVTEKGHAYQQVLPAAPVTIPLIDLSDLDHDQQRQRTERLIAEVEAQSFDLASGKLLHALLIKLGTEEFILSMTMHHIISDAWSLSVLMREFQILYAAFKEERDSQLPELELQYADFAVWQREWLQGEVLDRHQSYWRQKLSGLKPLELPTDYPRLATRTPQGDSIAFSLPEDLSAQIKELTQRERVTLFMTLIAAFQLVLGKTANQQDVAVGTSIANRNHLETENLIGFFVNELVLRADLQEAFDFRSLLRQVRQTVLEAYAYQDMPFDALVEELAPDRIKGRSPLFDVLFVLHNTPIPSMAVHDLELNAIPATATSSKFDLTMFMYEGDKQIAGELHFDATLFEAATIERFIARFERVLSEVCANPDAPLFLISLTSPLEAEALIADFSDSWAHADS
ncbi:MAG TPA: amino acid adenylation domain-containing protein [Pyrinomonadaceae bacterium]|nr:amino acid adenylation domain-containing protein [Pyrinomonadaceae bacterium]